MADLHGKALLGLAILAASAMPLAAGEATKEMVAAALPKLDAYINDNMQGGMVPGLSVAIVFQDEVVYLAGFGVREVGKPEKVDADTVFQLASFSKPISSTVVAALVSDGAVSWDSRIANIDPTFQLSQPYPTEQVTVRDFFSHRSGLPGDSGNDLEGLGYDRDTILNRLRLVAPSSSFRAGYSYSNFGLTEGAVAAAKPTGMTWEDVAEAKLYKPLGMSSTSSRYADFIKRDNRAALHVRYSGDTWQALSKRVADAQAPAGGVSSSARDLAEWMRLELGNGSYAGKQLINAAAIGETHIPVMSRGAGPDGSPSFYALGWAISYGPHGVVWGHAGAFSKGARTQVSLIESEKLGIVILSNGFPTGAPDAIADVFFDMVFDGEPSRDWLTLWNNIYSGLFGPAIDAAKATYAKPSTTAALPESAYTGTYANDYIGNAVVAEESGGLVVKLGPDGKMTFPLKHFDRDLFIYYPYDEMPDTPFAVTFQTGPDQKATQVTFDDLNGEGFGTLTRVPK